MKAVTVVGARPQFIKAQPVSVALRKENTEVLVHTGQHYDREMSELFFQELGIPEPDHNLGVGSGSHGYQTAQMLMKLEQVLLDESPDLLVIYGDTNSTLAGALAAAKLHIPIAHVEAGLRSFNREMPEEINRMVADLVCDIRFCPTTTAVENLGREGITSGVHLVGDTMFDAQLLHKEAIDGCQIRQELGLEEGGYLLMTAHRPSNTDVRENLESIMEAVSSAGQAVVFPVHPRTEKYLRQYGLWDRYASLEDMKLIKPVGYIELMSLIKGCDKVLTDSGGVQKEAYFMRRPCITLREETEWVETVEDGWNILVGANGARISEAISKFEPPSQQHDHYGDGTASQKIVRILEGSDV